MIHLRRGNWADGWGIAVEGEAGAQHELCMVARGEGAQGVKSVAGEQRSGVARMQKGRLEARGEDCIHGSCQCGNLIAGDGRVQLVGRVEVGEDSFEAERGWGKELWQDRPQKSAVRSTLAGHAGVDLKMDGQ